MRKLKHVARLVAGGTPTVDDATMWAEEGDPGLPWVSIGDMSSGGVVERAARRISPLGVASKRLERAGSGTTLFAMYASVGAVATLGIEAVWNQALLGVAPQPGRSDGRFLGYWLRHLSVDLGAIVRTSTQDNLNADQVSNFPFTDLGVVEQRKIADFLDDQVSRIDQAVTLREVQMELLRIRQRSMVERFLGDVDPGSQQVRLQRLMYQSDARVGPAVDAADLLSVSIHHGVRRRSAHTGDAARADDLQKYKVVRANDLVVNRMRAFQGGLGIAPVKGIVSPDYAVIRLGSQIDPWFLHHLSRSSWFVGEMTARLRGIGSVDQGNVRTPRINVEDFLRIEVPSIGMIEQRAAASAFQDAEESVRRQVSLFDAHAVLLRERKRALITAAVTGEFDVTTASGMGVA